MNQVWTPSFRHFPPKKLVGFQLEMSLTQNRTGELWQRFMQNRHLIQHTPTADRFSMQIYPAGYFSSFNPATPFNKWAVAEVPDFTLVPEGMETIEIPGGMYACFFTKALLRIRGFSPISFRNGFRLADMSWMIVPILRFWESVTKNWIRNPKN